MFDQLFDAALLDSVVRATVPILLAAIGGLICERAGVFQVSLEGTMLLGAFTSVSVSYVSGNAYLGLAAAMAAGVATSALLAFGHVTRKGDPIVLGIAINLFAVGITSFLLPQFFDVRGVFRDPAIEGLDTFRLVGLADSSSSWRGALRDDAARFPSFPADPSGLDLVVPQPDGSAPTGRRRETHPRHTHAASRSELTSTPPCSRRG